MQCSLGYLPIWYVPFIDSISNFRSLFSAGALSRVVLSNPVRYSETALAPQIFKDKIFAQLNLQLMNLPTSLGEHR